MFAISTGIGQDWDSTQRPSTEKHGRHAEEPVDLAQLWKSSPGQPGTNATKLFFPQMTSAKFWFIIGSTQGDQTAWERSHPANVKKLPKILSLENERPRHPFKNCGQFGPKIVTLDLKKVAQSGHTGSTSRIALMFTIFSNEFGQKSFIVFVPPDVQGRVEWEHSADNEGVPEQDDHPSIRTLLR